MKITKRFSNSNLIYCLSLFFLFFLSVNVKAQTISGTNGTSNCVNCAPSGWTISTGTPDISDTTNAGVISPSFQGSGATWVNSPTSTTPITLPTPINSHSNWVSLLDTGSSTQDAVTVSLTGLTIGRSYEVIVYSLTAVTAANGQANKKYAGSYNDSFNYQFSGSSTQSVSPISENTWTASKLRFTASGATHDLTLRGGLNATSPESNYQTVQISVTPNAINGAPIADDNVASTLGGTAVTFNVISTDTDPGGSINPSSVDLNVALAGIQNSVTNAQGTWTVDASGDVTFTPVSTFSGNATINYTVNDNYTLDGVSRAATSNQATLTVNVLANPSIEATKTFTRTDNGDGVPGLGDIIVYTITIQNTGNVVLTNINLTDTFQDINGNPLTLTTGPTLVSSPSPSGTLTAGQTATYRATYNVSQAAVDAGGVSNSVFVTGESPANGTVNDTSDDGDDSDLNTVDDPTITLIPENPMLDATKTYSVADNGDGTLGVNDVVTFTIRVTNIGNVTLTGVGIVDTLEDYLGASRSLTTGPTFVNATQTSPAGTLKVNETARYTATYVITQADVNAGGIRNSVLASATSPAGTNISDVSDDNDDADGNTVDDPTEIPIIVGPSIEVTKTASLIDNGDGVTGVDDVVTYTITVENKGNVNLINLSLVDTLQDLLGNPLTLTTGITFAGSTQGSAEGSIVVGETATYTATYSLTQSDVNAGGISNSVVGSASTPGGTVTNDTSDDGIDSDGNTTNDPTVTTIVQTPAIEATKTYTVSDNGDGMLGVDDIISYTITIRNTGNVFLDGVILSDVLRNVQGVNLALTTGPTFVGANRGSSVGNLRKGEIATYTATYALTQASVDAGGVRNFVSVRADSPQDVRVTDISDDGDDSDGNTVDDPTETLIPENTIIEVTKTATLTDNGDGVTGIDDVISYTITIENKGNVTVNNLNLTDTLEDILGNSLSLTTGPTFVGSDQGSPQGRIKSGEIATYTATFVLTQNEVNNGGVSNSVLVSGTSPSSTPVNDVSDDGIDSDGNTTDDPTETLISQNPDIEATKIASISDNGNNVLGVGDVVNYTILIKNTGNVDLDNVSFTDTLEDFNNNPRSLTTGPTFVSADLGSTQGNLLVGETATYTATYSIRQADVNAGGIRNVVIAQGDSPIDITVSDVSDDGDDTDGNTVDDPTETITPEFPILEATKVASVVDDGDGEIGVNDLVNYSITVRNVGNVNLSNVDITDTLTDMQGNGLTLTTGPTFVAANQGSPEGILLVNETATYTAVYVITQSDVDAGGISNRVVAEGRSPFGIDITDTSDDGNDNDGNTVDDPTETIITENPSLEATKTASISDNGDGSLGTGDTINYTITIENTGNVTLDNVGLTDNLSDLLGNSLVLTSGPNYVSSDMGSGEGILVPGEIAIYTATYVLTQSDVDAGGVSNSAIASGDSPMDTNVTDTSDDGDDTDGNTVDDPTETLIPSMEITKTFSVTDNGDGILGADDIINYTITIENTGDISLNSVSIIDTLTDLLGNPRTLTTGPTFQSASQGSTEGNLLPGETATYIATYLTVIDDVVAGGLSNTVEGSGSSPDGDNVIDTSDDGDDTDGNTEDDPTITPIIEIPMLEATKIASITDDGDGVLGVNDLVTYTITVENTGNIPLINVSITDTLTDLLGNNLTLSTGPTFVGTNLTGIEGVLIPGEIATYTATYTLTQSDVDAGGISNTAVASGNTPLSTNVTDTSDDGDDSDGNTEDDPTETLIPEIVSLEATKTAAITDDGDGELGTGDLITYTITVQNNGNVTVNGITLVDTLVDFQSTSLTLTSGPDYVSSDSGSSEGTLQVGETATYTATYLITQSDVDAGGIRNSVIANGESQSGTDVTDTSDDGDDTDGNTEDDPTETPIIETPSLETTKTANVTDNGDGQLGLGDTITYTITIENTGNVTLNNISLADSLSDFQGSSLSLTTGPTYVSSSLGSAEGILISGEIASYTATYIITQSDVDAGGVSNSAIASGDSPSDTNVTDTSDDGDDTDGNTEDDPTETPITENPNFEITKTFSVEDNGDAILGAGDTITYMITVENTGTVTLSDITLEDNISDFAGGSSTLTTGPTFVSSDMGSSEGTLMVGEIATYTATYIILQSDVDAGGVSNTVLGTSNSPTDTEITDTSDDGDDTDGNTVDDPTETPIAESPSLEATKTYTITNNGSDILGAGDVINYTITVENTGNITLTGVSIVDTLSDFSRNPLSLTTGPVFDSADLGSPEGTLLPGEIAIYTATYIITQSDVDAGGVSNTVIAEGDSPGDTNVTDTSDDGDDTDGNTEDDPTETPIPIIAALEATKTADVVDNGDGLVGVGDVINYTITIENIGNVNVSSISFTDTFTDLLGVTLTFDVEPTFVSSSLGSDEGSLLVSEIATYAGFYTITQSDVDAGGVSNSVFTIGTGDDDTEVSDTSDDGDDEDGNTEDDPTETLTDSIHDLSITKDVDVREPLIGDNVTFTITLANDGLVTANNIVVTDLLPDGYSYVSSTTTSGVYSDSQSTWSVDQLNPGGVEMLQITVEVLGFGDYLNIATITDSDEGPDDDANNDTDSADVEPICLTIYNEFSPNGDGVNETFLIDCIENYPNSKLEVYNRWGNIVYETVGYRNDWSGTSNGRAVIGQGNDLPVGTYYYIIDLKNGTEPKTGWLYINR